MLTTKLIRTLIFTVLVGLCVRESVAQARYPATFTLKGTSQCVSNLPGCENETVVYRIEQVAGAKDRFMLYADTLIKGQRVPKFKQPLRSVVNGVSGPDFQFQTDANANQPSAQEHIYIALINPASDVFSGTISLTQNKTVVRRLNLKIVDPQSLPAAPRFQEYYYLKLKPVLLTSWSKDSTSALEQSYILLQLRTNTGERFRLDPSASDNITQVIQAAEAKNLRDPIISGRVTSIDVDPSNITVRFDSLAPLKSPINGDPVEWTRDDGVKFELKSWLRDGSLVQTLTAPDETITLTYTPSQKGQTLTIKFRMVKTRLPQTLTYKLVYNRAS